MMLTKYQRVVMTLGMPIRYDAVFGSARASDRHSTKVREPTVKALIAMGLIEKTERIGLQTDLYNLTAAGHAALSGIATEGEQ